LKAIVYQGKENIIMQEVDKPELSQDDVLIKVRYAGICGSDLGIYDGKHPRAKAPLIMGHEISGEIEEVGNFQKSPFRVGDRVTINPLLSCGHCQPCQTGNAHVCKNLRLVGIDVDGGFAEFVKVNNSQVVKLPDELSIETAALVEPLAVTIHAVRKSNLKIGDQVVVIGGGPIGLLTAISARQAGASKVIICEVSQGRLEFAERLGFNVVHAQQNPVEQIMQLTDGNGADIVYEAAGVSASAILATAVVRIAGQIVIVSVFKGLAEFDMRTVNFHELSIIGARVYTSYDFQTALHMLCRDQSISHIISHKLSLTQAQEGFDLMRKADNALKILFCL
jgi:(R,R)-butanediol dehydrogenase/meso-butanediol dehydrogenase/diacetyl reductase